MKIKETSESNNQSKNLNSVLRPIERHIIQFFPQVHGSWESSTVDYLNVYEDFFCTFHDPSALLGQENYTVYKGLKKIRLFIQDQDSALDVFRAITACLICQTKLEVFSCEENVSRLHLQDFDREEVKIIILPQEKFTDHFLTDEQGRNRIISTFPQEWFTEAAKKFAFVQAIPVFAIGRLELLHYLRAISVSDNYHRYGNLGNKKH